MKNDTDNLIEKFRLAFAPLTPMEEIAFWLTQAGQDLSDISQPEHVRFNSAIRLLCSIRAIGDHLSANAKNQIYGRAGVMPPPCDG